MVDEAAGVGGDVDANVEWSAMMRYVNVGMNE